MKGKCAVEGCEKQARKREWCAPHYEKWRRLGDPTANGRAMHYERKAQDKPVVTEKACKKCGVVKPLSEYYVRTHPTYWVYTKCKSCHKAMNEAGRHNRERLNPKPPRQKVDHGPCAFEGCRNKGKSQLIYRGGPEGWYCSPHYMQWWKNERLLPLQNSSKSYINEHVRRCTACDKIKPQYEFHSRKSGGSQSQCKACQYLVVRSNALAREARYEEALAMARTMPVAIREKYVNRFTNAIKGEAE